MTTDTKSTPDWDEYGNLPAIDEQQPTSRERSPYTISLVDLIVSFGTTQHRRGLLIRFLAFRAALHEAGVVRGFQWVNGSFVQNIEETDGLAPKDIDVVTFFYIPDDGSTDKLSDDNRELFDRRIMKERFAVDTYYSQLNQTTSEEVINESAYWYSLWSHTRGGRWKGYLQIDLSNDRDEEARLYLDQLNNGEGDQK